jgi:hypothetical protein
MAGRPFVVSCTHCKRVVLVVARVGSAELDRLRGHLLACSPSDVVGPRPGVEATLRHFHVAPTDPDDEPPPAA